MIKYTACDMIFSLDDWWHVVYETEYEGDRCGSEHMFCRCQNKEDAELIAELLNKREQSENSINES